MAAFEDLLKRNFIAGNTVMVRKNVFEDIGLYNPAELREVIFKFIKRGKEKDVNDAKSFVSQYWCLDDNSLQRWEEVLSSENT